MSRWIEKLPRDYVGAHVLGDRQRRSRLRAVWHLATDTAQVATSLWGSWRRRTLFSKPPPSQQP